MAEESRGTTDRNSVESAGDAFLRELLRVSQATVERELDAAPPAAEFTGNARFAVERKLGAGGFGAVYAAFDRTLSARVALKVLARPDPRWLYRFKLEFRALGHLIHPNLVTRYELLCDAGRWFFTMELVSGEDLYSYVRPGGRLDEARLRSALLQLAQGAHALHEAGMVHRDIKPSNALVDAGGRLVLLDFGLAREHDPHASVEQEKAGTPRYMSPEQHMGHRVGPASDWFSVGVVLHEALAGRQHGEHPSLPPDAPADLALLCRELLRADPEARPRAPALLERLGAPLSRKSREPEGRALFVGRERQLRLLHEAAQATAAGEPRWVTISGASGLGKTALAARFVEELRGQDARALVLRGRCHERETLPNKALDGVLDALGRFLRGLPEAEAQALLPPGMDALTQLFPALASGPPSPRSSPPDVAAATAALRELFTRLGRSRLCALVLDDLQWGDLDSVQMLGRIVEGLGAPPLLIVACQRAGEEETSPVLQALAALRERAFPKTGRELKLAELPAADMRELARRLSRDAGAATVEGLSSEAQGNPHLLALLSRRRAPGERPTLDAALSATIAALPEAARALLEVVAVAGRPLAVEVALQAAGPASKSPAAMATLRAGALVRRRESAGGSELECYHERIREAALRALGEEQLRRWHAALARELLTSAATDPERLAQHFLGAGDRAEAARQTERAGDHAAGALWFERAARLYGDALQLLAEGDASRAALQGKLGDALAGAGRPAEAAVAYAGARAPHKEAEQLFRAGQLEEGLARTRAALEAASLRLPRTWIGAVVSQLSAGRWARSRPAPAALDAAFHAFPNLFALGPRGALALQARHQRLALASGEPRHLVRALATEALFASLRPGQPRRAAALVQRAEELSRLSPELETEGLLRAFLAAIAACEGRLREACELAEAAEPLVPDARRGSFLEEALLRWPHGAALFLSGGWQELVHRAQVQRREHERRGDAWKLCLSQAQGGWLLPLLEDEPGGADAQVRELSLLTSRLAGSPARAAPHLPRAWVALYRGEPEAALAAVRALWPALRSSGLLRVALFETRARLMLAAALLLAGRTVPARREARRLSRIDLPWSPALALLVSAGADAQGRRPAAAAKLLAAEEALLSHDLTPYAMAGRRLRGSLLGGDGGAALQRSADEWFASRGARAPARIAAMLLPGFT